MKNIVDKSLLALAILSILVGCRTTYTWQAKGPIGKSGPVKQIIVDKKDSKKLYAATENGGVWVISDYTDENTLWKPLTDRLENLQTRGFDVSEHDPNIMVMGNGLGNLHLSRNGGRSWSKIDLPSFGYIRKIAIEDRLGTILIFNVASQNGLFKIEVRGNGQNPIVRPETIGDKEILDFVIDRNSERQNVRYYSARNDGVYKSIDYGRKWEKVLLDSSGSMIKIARPSKNGVTVIKVGRQLFANDSLRRNQFSSINRPPDNKFTASNSDISYRNPFGGRGDDWNHAVVINPKNSNEIVYGTFKPFYSSDKGASWAAVGFGHEDLHDIVYVNDDVLTATDGGVIRLIRNNDGDLITGHEYFNKGLNTFQFYRMAVNGTTAVGNADHNGIKYTENLNSEAPVWEDVYYSGYGNNGLENDFVYKDIKNPNRYFVQFQSMKLLRLNMPYRRYSRAAPGNDLFVFHDPDPSAFLNPFTLVQDSDPCIKNGDSLFNCNQFYNNLNYPIGTIAQDLRPASNTMLVSAHNSSSGTINSSNVFSIKITKEANKNPVGTSVSGGEDNDNRTWDYGALSNQDFPEWTVSHNNGNTPIVSMAYASEENGNVYALDELGNLIFNKDLDSAYSWSRKTKVPSRPEELMRQLIIDKTNQENLFAISHDRIFRSSDSGQSWTILTLNLTNQNKINTIAQHRSRSETYFVGTDRGIYTSIDNGGRWHLLCDNVPNAPVMQLFTESDYLYAVTFGRGLWRCNLKRPIRKWIWQCN